MCTDSNQVKFSFELYPPRTESSQRALYETIHQLAQSGPEFISVTFGAGGSVGGNSLNVLKYIREHTSVEPLAHLTCVGNSYAGAAALIREFLDADIRSFLALRGDPPLGQDEQTLFLGDLESAAQLTQLIRRVQAERVPYTEWDVPGIPGAASIADRHQVQVAVAAFPNGHPRAKYSRADIDSLLAKQAAGATMAITQLFFHADMYLSFVQRCRDAGVHIPIVPGIMPIVSPTRLRRVLELTGEEVPSELSIALEIEPSAEGQERVGVAYAARLAREVLAGGAPSVHLYAFNDHKTVLAVLREAGILTAEKEKTS